METIYIYNGASRLSVPVTDSAERAHSLQQHNYVKLVWKSAENTPIIANAYIEYEGQMFYALDDYFPTHKDGIYEYDIEFHAIEDTFNRPLFFRYVDIFDQATGETTSWKEVEWSLNGNLRTIADIVIDCLNRAYSNVVFRLPPNNDYIGTELLNYSFSGSSIADTLSTIAEQNETEWWIENTGYLTIDNKRIYNLHFDKCEFGTTIELNDNYTEGANGVWQSGGLKSVSQSGNTNIIPQKLFVYGSERNIIKKTVEEQTEDGAMNVSYDKRLRLPKLTGFEAIYQNIALGLKATINEDSSITIAGINNHFEQVKFFDEVYPKMTMEVEEVFVQNPNSENPIYWMSADKLKSLVVEPANPDKVNPGKLGLLIEGCTLMCTFTSGLLNGREFECAWEESTARIGLVPIDEDDVQIPFGAYIPKAGDTFILWNLEMPKSAVEDAQRELLWEAIKYIEEIFTSTTETECISEAEAFRLNGYTDLIKVGQRIKVTSDVFRGALLSRVIKFSYKLTKPYDVNFTLASSRQTGRLATLDNMIADVTKEVHATGQVQRAISRRQWHDTEEMMQMLDSIQKQMVVVGDENSAFVTSCQVDWNNETKLLTISKGYIEHQSYKPDNGDGAWSVTPLQMSLASYSKDIPYYVFFACPKNTSIAEIGIDIALPEESDYYFFALGILSAEYEGIRVFNQSSGLTTLVGGTITTEVIQDAARQLIIDFTNRRIIARNGAEIIGNIKFLSDDGTVVDAFTAIDGGLVLTNLIRLLDDNGNTTLGLNGNQDYDNNVGGSLKLWSGVDYSNRFQAPFRVYDNGKVFGTNFYGFHSAYRVTESDIVDYMLNVRQFGSKVLLDFPTGLANALTFPSGMEYVGAEIELFNPYNRPVAICGQNIISPTIATLNNAFESVGTSAHISGYAYIYKENKARIVGSDDLYAIPRWSLKNLISCSVPNRMPNYMKWKCICFSYSSSEYNTQNVNANTYYIRVGQSAYIYFLPLWVLAESSNDITFNLEIE